MSFLSNPNVQLLIAALIGWAVRHWNLVGGPGSAVPVAPSAPSSAHPLLDFAKAEFDKILQDAVAEAARKGLMNAVVNPKPEAAK